MKIIAEKLPVIAGQAGVWEGTYVHLDPNNQEVDRHKSKLICRLEDGEEGIARFRQTNIYTWPDNSQETRYFELFFNKDRLIVNNDLIDGWTSSVQMDQTNCMILVQWTRPSEPGFRYYEMITVAADGLSRNRTWHTYQDNRLSRRTIVNEVRTSKDWQGYDDEQYLYYQPRL